MNLKYIITDDGAILFTEQASHKAVAQAYLDHNREIYSAGFCQISHGKCVRCHGESDSLGIKSDDIMDKIVINDMFDPIQKIKYGMLIVKDLYR